MTRVPVSLEQRQILSMFARGRDEALIADNLNLPDSVVNDTIVVLAGADVDRARALVAAYDAQAAAAPTAPVAAAVPEPPAKAAPATPGPKPAPPPAARMAAAPLTASLLERGARSADPDTRALAETIHERLAELHRRIEAEEASRLEAAAQAKERADAEQRVADLERLLAEARGNLAAVNGCAVNGHRAASPIPAAAVGEDDGVDPAAVRAWAEQEGVPCSSRGPLPGRVLAAWRNREARR